MAIHLSSDVLVRLLDGELAGSEALDAERHLAICGVCSGRQTELRRASGEFDFFVQSLRPVVASGERSDLAEKLGRPKGSPVRVGRTLGRFGWALAAAASVAIGISYLPVKNLEPQKPAVAQASRPGVPFEVDGETFLYLPYSNPDLPVANTHVVQMQVPLSSLADAGVLIEPLETRMTTPDRAVLADVLLGLDGQPIGVHVLSTDL